MLGRLVEGDPLGVRRRVAAVLRARALLLDADRVHLRALARCAIHGGRWTGRPPLEEWLAAQVERAAGEVLREAPEGGAVGGAEEGAHVDLARPLGLDPEAALAACDAFNRQPPGDREAFFRLVLEGASLDAVAREAGRSASDVARSARRALDAVLAAAGPDPGGRS